MQHVFLAPEAFQPDGSALLDESAVRHLATVLRMREGEKLVLLDNRGGSWLAKLEKIEKRSGVARIEEDFPIHSEPSVHLVIAQSLGKGDKLEQVIQHGVELGASRFIPIAADRSVVQVASEKSEDKRIRWQAISQSATEQSHRLVIPKVEPLQPLSKAIQGETRMAILHTAMDARPLKSWIEEHRGSERIALAIGPEGGWSDRELNVAKDAGVSAVSLGPRVLRTETAALCAISQLLYALDELEANNPSRNGNSQER